jgi:hypothetical protein
MFRERAARRQSSKCKHTKKRSRQHHTQRAAETPDGRAERDVLAAPVSAVLREAVAMVREKGGAICSGSKCGQNKLGRFSEVTCALPLC